ncbi:MmcQ/YjbR family DNA-binding protein [Nesterenkonia aerolata]|uniref:MmcQ/YjbR family DNA-binding protein n=1 Tax=Nesterenkonia aerolata TaxID=3074079 RepID=A0ABU2DUR7_9MICC|nr:MmcQ/YjbR family DNA-binding protein [Nesterenkonia sp. LY-0111]MDR8020229.1 MmcQ/YjbR family DNA-binding protein [Nesterenkonia sp. LY-0111]
MDGEQLHSTARRRAEALPGSSFDFRFGPDYEVASVRNRVFMLMTRVPEASTGFGVTASSRGQPVLVLKTPPEDAEALRASHPGISHGYHMNKRHWITVAPGDSTERQLVEELVTDSYCLVVAGLPTAERPVNPETFGAE